MVLGAALVALVAACAPYLEAEVRTEAGVRVTAASSSGYEVVRVPEARPRQGIQVRRAQGRPVHIPPGHYPPSGACRIWRPGVPPGRQAPSGPCSELERQVPPGAYLVIG
ncbi:MAG: hypothetical protein U5K81_13200 [Trueperaceae bacterium]|nr:hypothetical protein [Trueperaceae bacterium]